MTAKTHVGSNPNVQHVCGKIAESISSRHTCSDLSGKMNVDMRLTCFVKKVFRKISISKLPSEVGDSNSLHYVLWNNGIMLSNIKPRSEKCRTSFVVACKIPIIYPLPNYPMIALVWASGQQLIVLMLCGKESYGGFPPTRSILWCELQELIVWVDPLCACSVEKIYCSGEQSMVSWSRVTALCRKSIKHEPVGQTMLANGGKGKDTWIPV